MEQLSGEKDTIFIRLKNSIKKLWVEHYNYKPLQLVILSCIAGSTPFLSIGLSQLLPESFASEKDVPTTTVIMESPEESTVTETVEHYVTMPNGDIKTYTDDPNSSYSNKEPQDEQVDTTTRNNDNNNTNNDELTPRKNNDYDYRYENTPTPQQNFREYPTYHSPEPTLNNKQSPNDNTVRTPQNNIPHNNTNNNTNSNNSNNTGDTGNTNSNNSNNDNNMNNNMNTDSNNNVNNDY